MKKGLVWAIGFGLAVTVPVVALGFRAQAAATDTVHVQAALDSTGVSFRETSLGDLVADAVRQTANADIAFVAADELTETTIPAGNIPPGRFLKSLRYADDPTDTIVILSLTGAQLRAVAERSVSHAPQSFDGFLQVSGLKITYDPSQPDGKRVRSATIGGNDIQDGHTYRVATTRPVADGSFGYFRLWSKGDIKEDTHASIAAAFNTYLISHKDLDVHTENRIAAR